MKVHPILFSGPMVRAILDGKKTQTRRVVKPQPEGHAAGGWVWQRNSKSLPLAWPERIESGQIKCPYGTAGYRLWVRENWAVGDIADNIRPRYMEGYYWRNHGIWYRSDEVHIGDYKHKRGKWRVPIHMPRWASRITLEIKSVRAERLQDITEEGAIAEGSQIPVAQLPKTCRSGVMTERCQFSRIWDSINGRKHPWESNPWVWAIEFKQIV